MMTPSHTQPHPMALDLQLMVAEAGQGRPVLILHGGGGPATVASIGAHLARTMHTLIPTHPGWNGIARPDWLTGIDDLALTYLNYLSDHALHDVLVIGSSIGGWIAAEMAVRDRAGLITGLILIDAVGVKVEGAPIRNFFALDARGVATYCWHDAERFYTDPTTLPTEQRARQQGNMATLRLIAGDDFYDPKLLIRLGRVPVPALLLWGESDRIVTPAYGTAYAAAFSQAQFTLIARAGHLPHIEQPAATFAQIDAYVQGQARGTGAD